MTTDLNNLLARRSTILAELAIGETPSGASIRKPSYHIDGQSVDWNAYRKSLYEELARINELITATQGPFEVSSEAT